MKRIFLVIKESYRANMCKTIRNIAIGYNIVMEIFSSCTFHTILAYHLHTILFHDFFSVQMLTINNMLLKPLTIKVDF